MSQARAKVTTPPSPPISATVIAFCVMILATIAGLIWTASVLSDPAALPIRRVMVEGEFKHLSTELVQKAVVGAVHGGFFSVDVAEIRRLLAGRGLDPGRQHQPRMAGRPTRDHRRAGAGRALGPTMAC